MMKRALMVLSFFGVLALAVPAFAAQGGGQPGVTVDASLLFATAPEGAFDATVGIGVGALVDLSHRMNMSSRNMKLGVRGDISYYSWDGSAFGIDLSYTRLAFFGGPRFTFAPGNAKIEPYVEGGLELTFDKAEVAMPFVGKASASDTSLGFAGGGGVDFILAPNVKLGVNGRLHLVSDSFLTIGATIGLMF